MVAVPQRSLPCSDNSSPLPTDAVAYANQENAEIKGLWNSVNLSLGAIAGTNSITAECLIQGAPLALPSLAEGQEFTFIPVNTTTGPVTLTIDSTTTTNVLDQTGAALSGTICMQAGIQYTLRYTSGSFRVKGLSALPTTVIPFPMLWKGGLQCANDASDLNNNISVQPGSARNSVDTQNIVSSAAIIKKTNVVWAAGTNQGGMLVSGNLVGTVTVSSSNGNVVGSGTSFTTDFAVGHVITTAGGQSRRITSISTNTAMTVESNWSSTESAVTYKRGGKAKSCSYKILLLRKDADGTGDIAFSPAIPTSVTDLPAGYSTYRRIGYVMADSSANNARFYHSNDDRWRIISPLQIGSFSLVNGAQVLTMGALAPNLLARFFIPDSIASSNPIVFNFYETFGSVDGAALQQNTNSAAGIGVWTIPPQFVALDSSAAVGFRIQSTSGNSPMAVRLAEWIDSCTF